jgi:hypothetical protein
MEPPSESNSIIGVESLDLAQQVIRSLRCKSSSQNRYLNTPDSRDGFASSTIHHSNSQYFALHAKDLNQIIEVESNEISKKAEKLRQINDAIDHYEAPSSRDLSVNHFSKSNYQTSTFQSNTKAPKQSVDNDSDDFESDDDLVSVQSKGKKARNLRNAIKNGRQHFADFGDSCDYDAVDNNRHVKSTIDNLDMDFDDDDEEGMRELFKDFVAPRNGKGSQSSHNHSKGKLTQNNDNILSMSAKKGITIKPGQAIRVKPSGSKGKKANHDES